MKKKRTALLLALALLLTLTGCGARSAEPAEPAEPTAAPPEAPAADGPADGIDEELAAAVEAQTQAIVDTVKRVRATYDPDQVVCTVDGSEVTWNMYYYFIVKELEEYIYYVGALPEDYSMLIADGTTLEDYLKQVTLAQSSYYTVTANKARELGAELSPESEAAIQEYWDYLATANGGEAALLESLLESCLDKGLYLAFLRGNEEQTNVMDELYGTGGEKLSDEDVISWAEEQGFIRIKHVLYFFYDDAGNPLDEEGKAEQLARAEATLAELRALEGDPEALEARFDEIMAADTGDAGGLSRFPDGYTFTAGTMYPVFEEAAFALENYQVSEITESQSGYHILLRLPLDPDGLTMDQDSNTGAYMTLRSSAANEIFIMQMAEWVKQAEVVWTEGFEDLDLNKLFGVGVEE